MQRQVLQNTMTFQNAPEVLAQRVPSTTKYESAVTGAPVRGKTEGGAYLEALLDAVQTANVLPADVGNLDSYLPESAWPYAASCSLEVLLLDHQSWPRQACNDITTYQCSMVGQPQT